MGETPGDAAKGRLLSRGDAQLSFVYTPGSSPTVVFLSGYASNMNGTKALYLERDCVARGQAYLRLDYQGHGESSGRFEDGTLGQWADDACAIIEAATAGPLLLVGSSMGGWIALIVARRLGERVTGLVGIAAAPDFGDDVWNSLGDEGRTTLLRRGVLSMPSEYGPEPSIVTLAFIEESRRHNQLGGVIPLRCPVRLLHGMADADVSWRKAIALSERLASDDVRMTLLKSAGHRFSARCELALIGETVMQLANEVRDGE